MCCLYIDQIFCFLLWICAYVILFTSKRKSYCMSTQLFFHYPHVLYSHIINRKMGSLTNLRLNLCWLFSFHNLQISWRFNSIWTLVATANKMTVIKMMQNIAREILFSSPEPKAQVNFITKKISGVCRCCRCKLFTVSSSSPKPLSRFQRNLAQSNTGLRGLQFVLMKGHAFLKEEIIKNYW